ncbi:hypothetical protein ACFSQE_08935 [Vogesella fluminis]|uniref:Uncharacterized protein n=1 Tax=Vogesella fluminis TaxID=1069161 RepID=A0ABQ3HAU8_9NEIS|nr:hypothetical protein [Vogesella fluminis]GHD79535.1 hypothetical protein GCM10011419_23060 [Vogesella fluminis]
MYDCEQDRYTEFATTPARSAPLLRGELRAIHLGDNTGARQLTALLAWASERGLTASLQQGKLLLQDVDVDQALQINRLFGNMLIISCHLRRPDAA